jgi:hypothetical protein
VCGTARIHRGLPRDMIEEAKMLKKGEDTSRRKQNVLLLSLVADPGKCSNLDRVVL